jgi:hypothetical protein
MDAADKEGVDHQQYVAMEDDSTAMSRYGGRLICFGLG